MPVVPVKDPQGKIICELDVPDDASVISPPEGSPFQRMIRCRMCKRWSWELNVLTRGPWCPDGQLGHQFVPWAEGTEWKPEGLYVACNVLAVVAVVVGVVVVVVVCCYE